MSPLIFILFIAACAMVGAGRRRGGLIIAASGLFLFWIIGSGALPRILLKRLQSHPRLSEITWKKKNVIVVLGMGTVRWGDFVSTKTPAFSRNFEAARLYFDCKKHSSDCRVLGSGDDPAHNGVTEAQTIQRDLESIGVREKDILIETKSRNTYENAKFSSEIISREAPDCLVLVTSGIHLNRALLLFSHFSLHPLPAPADYFVPPFSLLTSSQNLFAMDVALHEYGGRLQFQIYEWMGWNN